jgi:hypothetical protein
MDERHAQLAAMRTDVHKVGELTHLVDLDFDARLLRLASLRLLTGVGRLFRERLGFEAAEIRMIAREKPAARVAFVARL